MRRTILALLAAALITPATAQVPSTLPANTVVGRLGIGSGPAQAIPFSVLLANLLVGSPTISGGLTINPTAATLNQALNITQTGPASGASASGPTAFNLFNITYSSATTGSGLLFGQNNNNTYGLRENFTVGGSGLNAGGPTIAASFQMRHTANSAATDKIGLNGAIYSNATDTTGGLFGGISSNFIDTTGVAQLQVGHEIDVGTLTGGTTNNRFGLTIVPFAPVQGSVRDAAIMVSGNNSGVGVPGGFTNLMLLSNYYGVAPLATTANIFSADTAYTVNDVLHYANMTVTGNILNFAHATLSGAGSAAFDVGMKVGTQTPANATFGPFKCYQATSCYYAADDGTHSAIFGADVTSGVAGTVSNHDFRLISNNAVVATVLAAGNIKYNTAANFSANGSVATVLGSIGPVGSHTTVQKWLTIVDNTGATLYIPSF